MGWRWPWKRRSWWCGAGHEASRDESYGHPELPREQFCSVEHLDQELGLARSNRRLAAELPHQRRVEQKRIQFLGHMTEGIEFIASPQIRIPCPACGKPLHPWVGEGKLLRIDGLAANDDMELYLRFKVGWPPAHMCPENQEYCRERNPDCGYAFCTKPVGHDGHHGYAGMFWESSVDVEVDEL